MATISFGDRLRLFRKALVGVFSEQSVQSAWGLLAGIYPGAIGAPTPRGTRERLNAFAEMPWLHAVADRVASAFAAVEWQLFVTQRRGEPRSHRDREIQKAPLDRRKALLLAKQQAGELRQIDRHLFLDLMESANSFQTGLSMRKVSMLHWDLAGEVFWLKERNGASAPVSVWPLPSNWILNTPTPTNRKFRVQFRGWHGEIPDTEILWFPNVNPENPYGRGVGMSQVLADELETDEYAARHARQLFLNQARPDFVVWPEEGTIRPEETRRLEDEWLGQHQGFWRAFKPRFAGRKLGIHEFQPQNFRALQFVQLRQFEWDAIRQVWGIPPEIMGVLEKGSNRATVRTASFIFARWVLVPRLEAFRSILQERLIPEYDDRLILDYVSPVEADADHALEVGKAAPWAITVDEWRAQQGLEPLDGKRGAVFLVPFNLMPTEQFTGAGTPQPQPSAGQQGRMDLSRLSIEELYQLRGLVGRASE